MAELKHLFSSCCCVDIFIVLSRHFRYQIYMYWFYYFYFLLSLKK